MPVSLYLATLMTNGIVKITNVLLQCRRTINSDI